MPPEGQLLLAKSPFRAGEDAQDLSSGVFAPFTLVDDIDRVVMPVSADNSASLRLRLFGLTDSVFEVVLEFLLELLVFAWFHNDGFIVDILDNVHI